MSQARTVTASEMISSPPRPGAFSPVRLKMTGETKEGEGKLGGTCTGKMLLTH